MSPYISKNYDFASLKLANKNFLLLLNIAALFLLVSYGDKAEATVKKLDASIIDSIGNPPTSNPAFNQIPFRNYQGSKAQQLARDRNNSKGKFLQ